jgi:phage-related protein
MHEWRPATLLRQLQRGEKLSMPHSRPMPVNWRIVYRMDEDAIVILDVFGKKTRATPKVLIENCRKRLKEYDDASRET